MKPATRKLLTALVSRAASDFVGSGNFILLQSSPALQQIARKYPNRPAAQWRGG
jgi:hypothetical protein